MTRCVLDTNIVSLLIRDNPAVHRELAVALGRGDEIIFCPLVGYEVRRGGIKTGAARVLRQLDIVRQKFAYYEFTAEVWERAADLWAFCREEGQPIPDADVLIAAYSIELNAVLVTANTRHFTVFRSQGLTLENWTTP